MAIFKDGVEQFRGLVLRTSVKIDSLFEVDTVMAEVWNADKGKPEWVAVVGRQWGFGCFNGVPESIAKVDATPEVQEMAARWHTLSRQTWATKDMYRDSCELRVGSTVRVVSGRKIKKGTIGKVERVGESGYGKWAIVDGTLTAVTNLVVIPDLTWWE